MMTRIEEVWREIETQSTRTGLFRRVDYSHPLDLYAGIDHQGKRVLMLVAHDMPAMLPPPGIVEVACNQRGDNEWAIIFQLARPDFDELFGRLCQDLIDSTRDSSPEHAGDLLLRRLGRWRRLLEVGHRRTLSEAELRGLIGELWFLHTVALPLVGPAAAVKGWLGPLAAPHDFLLCALLVEIKTCVPGSDDVTIASLQQLDARDAPLYLGVVRLASVANTTVGAFTPAELLIRIRQDIETNQSSVTEFEFRLAETGYADDEEYTRSWYEVSGLRYFHVRQDFPRLIPSGVPDGVSDVSYTIDLRSCAPFAVESPMRQQ